MKLTSDILIGSLHSRFSHSSLQSLQWIRWEKTERTETIQFLNKSVHQIFPFFFKSTSNEDETDNISLCTLFSRYSSLFFCLDSRSLCLCQLRSERLKSILGGTKTRLLKGELIRRRGNRLLLKLVHRIETVSSISFTNRMWTYGECISLGLCFCLTLRLCQFPLVFRLEIKDQSSIHSPPPPTKPLFSPSNCSIYHVVTAQWESSLPFPSILRPLSSIGKSNKN